MIDNLVVLENDYVLTKTQYYDFLKKHACETCDNTNCCGLCEFRESKIAKEYSTLTSIYLMARRNLNRITDCHNCKGRDKLSLCEYCGWYYCSGCMHKEDQCKQCYEVMK